MALAKRKLSQNQSLRTDGGLMVVMVVMIFRERDDPDSKADQRDAPDDIEGGIVEAETLLRLLNLRDRLRMGGGRQDRGCGQQATESNSEEFTHLFNPSAA
jgi:hypothetical protein